MFSREARSTTAQNSLDLLSPSLTSWQTVYQTAAQMVEFHSKVTLIPLNLLLTVNSNLIRDVWICFAVQRDISGAEELTITSEYGGKKVVIKHIFD